MRRREAFVWAFAGAVASPGIASAAGPPHALSTVLEVQRLAVFVSEHLLAGGSLGTAAAAVIQRISSRDQTHVQLLSAAVARLGEPPAPAPTSAVEADRRLSALNASGRLAHVHDEADSLRLLYDVESIVIGRCWEALHTLTGPPLIRTTAAIMAAEAQHASAIGGLLHPGKWSRVIPVALVEGRH